MNEEIKKNEICEEELENINGGKDLGILPGFGETVIEQRNKENVMELNVDGVSAILNPFNVYKG